MARFLKSRKEVKGAPPGSLIFMGRKRMEAPRIRLIQYDDHNLFEEEFPSIQTALAHLDKDKVNWLNIDGIHQPEIIEEIGRSCGVTNLALENVLNTGGRSKYFEDNNSITIITKSLSYDSESKRIAIEQISFVLIDRVLISFQEQVGDHFEPVRERIRRSVGKIRTRTPDYLMYALTDCLVDNYLINLERMGAEIEGMEEQLEHPNPELSKTLYRYKTEISLFRKAIKPLREVLTRVLRAEHSLIEPSHMVFYQELYDIEEQAIEAADSYFNMTSDLINLYNTNVSNKVNEVMKVLTIFASIFIPLTFIAGIYGTNFDYVPELHYKGAYFVMWGVMIAVAGIMLYYFRRNKWF